VTTWRRHLLFAALYFSEGAPIGFLWWALPTRLRASGVEVDAITGLLALLVLPWALKFLGAPFIDLLRGPRWPLRAWIAACQVLMGVLMLATLAFDWQQDFAIVGALLLAHAMAAAAQDVSVDAYAVQVVPPAEFGATNAWMQGGVLTGRSLFGGGALLIDAWLGPRATVLLLVLAIWSSLAVLVAIGEREPGSTVTLIHRRREFGAALAEVLGRRSTWLVIAFAAVGGAGYEAVGIVVGPFLIDRGFGSAQVGAFLFVPVVAAMIAGSFAAGRLADAVGHVRAVGASLVGMAAVIVALAWGSDLWPAAITLALLVGLYVLIGAFTTTSYVTDRRLGATQLSASMSATNLCESWAAYVVGRLIADVGYGPAFTVMALVSLAGLPLLWRLRRFDTTRAAR
jgi:predicted MFS family arabinose efflux permease